MTTKFGDNFQAIRYKGSPSELTSYKIKSANVLIEIRFVAAEAKVEVFCNELNTKHTDTVHLLANYHC